MCSVVNLENNNQNLTSITYICVRCEKLLSADQLSMMIEVKCPNCGFRVLRKTRPPIVKRVKAR